MDSKTSLESKRRLEETQRQRERLLSSCMATLAAALGVEITKERIILYQRPMAELSEQQIKAGFALALKEYKPFGGSFPSPGELRDYALRHEVKVFGFIDDASTVLGRGTKPPDWEPIPDEEMQQFRDRLKNANGWPGVKSREL